jgi:dehydrogenase/reductase SDR family protein 12
MLGCSRPLARSPPQALASRGATLYMLCRNQQRGTEAAERVREATGNRDVHLAVSRLHQS